MNWIEILAKLGIAYLAIGGILFLIAIIAVIIAFIEFWKER